MYEFVRITINNNFIAMLFRIYRNIFHSYEIIKAKTKKLPFSTRVFRNHHEIVHIYSVYDTNLSRTHMYAIK